MQISLQGIIDKASNLLHRIPEKYIRGWKQALIVYGAYTVISNLIPHGRALIRHLFANPKLTQLYGQCWAVVTGATDGLGKAYAELLVKQGFDVIIVGRSQDKLLEVKKQLSIFGRVESIQFDFDTSDQQAYKKLADEIKAFGDVGVLINCLGAFYQNPFEVESKVATLTNLNIFAGTYLSQELVNSFKKRQRSLLVFVGSETGENPHPGYAIQASTKAYTGHLARSLAREFNNIDVRLFTPGPTYTRLLLGSEGIYIQQIEYMKTLWPRWFGSKPEDVARDQLRKVNSGEIHIAGTFRHGAMLHILRNYPNSFKRFAKLCGERI